MKTFSRLQFLSFTCGLLKKQKKRKNTKQKSNTTLSFILICIIKMNTFALLRC